MNNPGVFSLGDLTLGGAGTQTGAVVGDLAGMTGLALQARLSIGTAQPDASLALFLQTSLDQEQSWFDLAALGYSAANGGVLVAGLGLAAAAPARLGDGVLDPGAILSAALLGDRLRVKAVVGGGGYGGGTLLSVWGCAR